MRFLTDFADQAVILPMILAVAITLALQGWLRGALIWLAAMAVTFLAVLVLKLTFLSCQPVFGPWHVSSPSGHVAAATVVVGGLVTLLTRHRPSILSAAVMAAVGIGCSRLILHAHTVPEVLIGAAIGLTGAMFLTRITTAPPTLRALPLICVVAVVAMLFHGLHLPAEAAIRDTAYHAAWFIPACRG